MWRSIRVFVPRVGSTGRQCTQSICTECSIENSCPHLVNKAVTCESAPKAANVYCCCHDDSTCRWYRYMMMHEENIYFPTLILTRQRQLHSVVAYTSINAGRSKGDGSLSIHRKTYLWLVRGGGGRALEKLINIFVKICFQAQYGWLPPAPKNILAFVAGFENNSRCHVSRSSLGCLALLTSSIQQQPSAQLMYMMS